MLQSVRGETVLVSQRSHSSGAFRRSGEGELEEKRARMRVVVVATRRPKAEGLIQRHCFAHEIERVQPNRSITRRARAGEQGSRQLATYALAAKRLAHKHPLELA